MNVEPPANLKEEAEPGLVAVAMRCCETEWRVRSTQVAPPPPAAQQNIQHGRRLFTFPTLAQPCLVNPCAQ